MAAKRPLRVATAADAKPVKPKSMIETVAEGGSYLEFLKAQRLEMMQDVKEVTGPAKAALHRQIALHSKEIAALDAAAEQEAAEDVEVADEPFNAEAL